MTPDQRKLLRDALVTALVTMGRSQIGLNLATLKGAARAAGFLLDDEALARELDYLVQRGLAAEKPVKLSAGAKRWISTADAFEYCEAEGLV